MAHDYGINKISLVKSLLISKFPPDTEVEVICTFSKRVLSKPVSELTLREVATILIDLELITQAYADDYLTDYIDVLNREPLTVSH